MLLGVHNITFKSYSAGSYFGEIEVFDNNSRFHSARAQVDTDLLSIEQHIFKSILSTFPDYYEEIRQTSLEKLKRERDSIEKLQSLTGLSSNSTFFRKKRTQSLYKSVKQRQPVELMEIQEVQSDEEMPTGTLKLTKRSSRMRSASEKIVSKQFTEEDEILEESKQNEFSVFYPKIPEEEEERDELEQFGRRKVSVNREQDASPRKRQ